MTKTQRNIVNRANILIIMDQKRQEKKCLVFNKKQQGMRPSVAIRKQNLITLLFLFYFSFKKKEKESISL
jgi:hypothetical protein